MAETLDEALALIEEAGRTGKPISVGLLGNAAEVLPEMVRARRPPRPRHRPDQRPRPDQRLPAARLDRRGMGGQARLRSRRRRGRGAEILRRPRTGHAGLPGGRHPGHRLRQQHPPGRLRPGRDERLRLPGLRAGLYPPAVLSRDRAVPLGVADRRSGGYPQDRRGDEKAVSRQRRPAPLARHGRRADRLPGPARAHLLDRSGRPPPGWSDVQRDGGLGRALSAPSSSAAITSTAARSPARTARPRR